MPPSSSTIKLPTLLEACSKHVQSSGVILGSDISKQMEKDQYHTLLDCIPAHSQIPYLRSLCNRQPTSHKEIHQFIAELGRVLHAIAPSAKRIALVLPNGPELACAILGVSSFCGCVPLSATGAVSEVKADLQRCGPDLVIGPYAWGVLTGKMETKKKHTTDWTAHGHVEQVAKELNIPYAALVPSPEKAGPFRLVTKKISNEAEDYYTHISVPEMSAPTLTLNSGDKEAIVLFTSGTTGNKKLVPHVAQDLYCAAVVIALSWELNRDDVNCNLMPLFHVGGIVRQVFAPLVSGSAVICCPAFDANTFWELLAQHQFNWYYAAPTMHQMILQTGEQLYGDCRGKFGLKMIANAAGGLLPSLAQEMKDTYKGVHILPSYGMTECMPISSPPANYQLDKPGTSGVPVGPEVGILNTVTVERLPPMQEGPICVRGAPTFRGYGTLANQPNEPKPESFLKEGWFNTGDLGYLDEDGYLYITGRSKEVINRGGEIIAPMEVEEAVNEHPLIRACAAFSVPHAVLQETVGLVVVLKDESIPRGLDLPALQKYVSDKLASPKWPQCLVFMKGGLPKSHTNKLLRVKLGTRLGIPELNDEMGVLERTFECQCPPQGRPLTEAISCKRVHVDPDKVQVFLRDALKVSDDTQDLFVVAHPTKPGAVIAYVSHQINRLTLIGAAMDALHRYAVPSHIGWIEDLPSIEWMEEVAPKPRDAVASILNSGHGGPPEAKAPIDPEDVGADTSAQKNKVVEDVMDMYVSLLNLDYLPTPDAHFFHIGGSSMKASQLAGSIRKTFGVTVNGAEIFHHPTPTELGGLILKRQSADRISRSGVPSENGNSDPKSNAERSDHESPFSHKHTPFRATIGSSLIMMVPMFVLFPAFQIARYLTFFTLLLEKSQIFQHISSDRSIVTFILAYLIYYMAWITFVPLIFVAIKWTVIGRYEAGSYRIWGAYYLRWWIVDVCRKMFLRGIWGTNDRMLRLYYKMLGAHIAPGARISLDCDLAEYDLVHVGKHACLEQATVRGFAVDNGAMMLGPVYVGRDASVGIRSVVAPWTQVPDGQHLGPVTSSYDVTPGKALCEQHYRTNRQAFPEPSMLFQTIYGFPILFFVDAFAQIPPMYVLWSLLEYKSRETDSHFFRTWNELIDWLCDPARLPFFIGIRLARALLSPFFYMFAAILVKRFIIGKFRPGPRTNSTWETFRYYLAAKLFTRKKMQKVTELIGRHYEGVSILYRLLGAKIGKRVFWPGSQPVTDGTFDLLTIGDDAVFGSRSSILCTTIDRAEPVVLCAGANVSDNCVVMAGSVVGKNAVLGSNSICLEGMYLPSGSVWFGSNGCEPTCLQVGDGEDVTSYQSLNDERANAGVPVHASRALSSGLLPLTGDDSTIRPFGRAFYQGRASYRVWRLPAILTFTWLNRIFQVLFHLFPLLGAVQLGAVVLYADHVVKDLWRSSIFSEYKANAYSYTNDYGQQVNRDKFLWWTRDFDNAGHAHFFGTVYMAIFAAFIFMHFIRVMLWLVIELGAKWMFMGRRQPGRYNYDTSSYAQRWELYQLTAKIRKVSRLNLLQFIAGTPFMNWYFRMNGGTIGDSCCLYPSGADPFMPEPDLVTIGNRSVVDCASIVCHLNTRGNFELQPIIVEEDCTLRTRSRIQQGVRMETGSMILEKSLAMTGEIIDARSVWQGGPASIWFRYADESVANYKPPSAIATKRREIEMKSLSKGKIV